MRIQRLHLENYRGFASLDLDLSRGQTTALVGANGSGKTAVLKALSLLTGLAAKRIGLGEEPLSLLPTDVRGGTERCLVGGTLVWEVPALASLASHQGAPAPGPEGFSLQFEIKLGERGGQWSRGPDLSPGETWSVLWREELRRGRAVNVPTLANFWIDRFTASEESKVRRRMPEDPLAVYGDRLFDRLTNRDEFLTWFRLREDYENEVFRDRRDYVDPQLDAVRRALLLFLPNCTDLRVRRRPTQEAGAAHLYFVLALRDGVLTLRKDGTLLAFSQLSDGEQGLLVLVGDIARRLAITHSGLADPLRGHGIVLIDEVELHLHPRWQRTLIPNLERAFPNLQFIITTHSPQVLSLVPREQVKILRDFQIVEDPPHTLGRDSNAILYEVMGVEQYPPFAAEKVRTVARLIDDERWAEAREALAEPAREFGPNDAEVLRLGSMMEFLRDDEAAG